MARRLQNVTYGEVCETTAKVISADLRYICRVFFYTISFMVKLITNKMKRMFITAACLFALTAANADDNASAQENVIHECDYSTHDSYPWYSMYSNQERVEDGCLVIENAEEGLANWNVQYFVDDQVPVETGKDYTVRVTMRATGSGTLDCKMGDWTSSVAGTINFTADVQTIDCKLMAVPATPSYVVFQSGSFVGTIYISKVQVIETVEAGDGETVPVTVVKYDFEDGRRLSGWGNNSTMDITDGGHDSDKCFVVDNPSEANSWECQAAVDLEEALTEGETYYLHFWAKAETAVSVNAAYQETVSYQSRGDYSNFNLTADWTEYTLKTVVTGPDCTRLCFNLGKAVGKTWLDDVEIYYMKSVGGGDNPGTSVSGVTPASTPAPDKIYTISGRKVEKAVKGLYIINGRKVVKK